MTNIICLKLYRRMCMYSTNCNSKTINSRILLSFLSPALRPLFHSISFINQANSSTLSPRHWKEPPKANFHRKSRNVLHIAKETFNEITTVESSWIRGFSLWRTNEVVLQNEFDRKLSWMAVDAFSPWKVATTHTADVNKNV